MNGDQTVEGVVIVRGAGDGLAQEVIAGSHRLVSDEPASEGGTATITGRRTPNRNSQARQIIRPSCRTSHRRR